MPKAAIFDLHGTLLDSVDLHAIAWLEAMVKFGHDVTFEQARRYLPLIRPFSAIPDLLQRVREAEVRDLWTSSRAIGVLCGGFTESQLRHAVCIEVYPGPAALLACFDESLLAK